MARSSRLLWWCARLVPDSFRERVLEPAWADLQLDEARLRLRGARLHLAQIIVAAECFRIATQDALWRRGRATPLVTMLVVFLAVASVVMMRMQYPTPNRH